MLKKAFPEQGGEELDRFFLLLFSLIGQYTCLDMCLGDVDGFKQSYAIIIILIAVASIWSIL